MINFLQQKRQINKDYTALYFALYMQGGWGMTVGYTPIPMYLANMQKRLLDYQELHSIDCNGELLAASLILESQLISPPAGIQTSGCTSTIVGRWRPCC